MGNQSDTESVKAAKKPHSCSWCAEHIDAGHPYKRYRWYDGGSANTVKMHPECYDASLELIALEGGEIEFMPGDSPRGCCCGYDRGCAKCAARKTMPLAA